MRTLTMRHNAEEFASKSEEIGAKAIRGVWAIQDVREGLTNQR